MTHSSVRDMVKSAQRELAGGNLLPLRAAELLTQLTALIGNSAAECLDADIAYGAVLLGCLAEYEAASRARIHAEQSAEYRRKREAHDVKDLTVELVRSLKIFCRTVE